jgi:hypothetical protein
MWKKEDGTLSVGLVGSLCSTPGLWRSLHAPPLGWRRMCIGCMVHALESTEAEIKFCRDIRGALVNKSFTMSRRD